MIFSLKFQIHLFELDNQTYFIYNKIKVKRQINRMQEEQPQQQQSYDHSTQSILSSLRQLQESINKDIQKMASLKTIFHETQQKKFLITFVNIMDRMSNELQKANQMYQSIDKQIEENQQCQYLSKELNFFQNQCIDLNKTLKDRKQRLQAQRERQIMLKNQQQYLERKLYQQAYKQMKYKSKLEAFSKKMVDKNVSEPMKSNRTFETRSKSMRIHNKSIELRDNTYEEIYKNRPRSLRRATSIKTEKKLNKTINLSNKWSVNPIITLKDN